MIVIQSTAAVYLLVMAVVTLVALFKAVNDTQSTYKITGLPAVAWWVSAIICALTVVNNIL